jgi:hypothetical protein
MNKHIQILLRKYLIINVGIMGSKHTIHCLQINTIFSQFSKYELFYFKMKIMI